MHGTACRAVKGALVAVKVIDRRVKGNGNSVDIEREAILSTSIVHPNVLPYCSYSRPNAAPCFWLALQLSFRQPFCRRAFVCMPSGFHAELYPAPMQRGQTVTQEALYTLLLPSKELMPVVLLLICCCEAEPQQQVLLYLCWYDMPACCHYRTCRAESHAFLPYMLHMQLSLNHPASSTTLSNHQDICQTFLQSAVCVYTVVCLNNNLSHENLCTS